MVRRPSDAQTLPRVVSRLAGRGVAGDVEIYRPATDFAPRPPPGCVRASSAGDRPSGRRRAARPGTCDTRSPSSTSEKTRSNGVCPRVWHADARRRPRAIELGRELDRAARTRGCGVGVVEEHGAEAAQRVGAAPSRTISLWSSSGSSVAERRRLRVLVDLGLPAVGDRRGQAGAGDRPAPCRRAARASALARPVLGAASGPHSSTRSSRCVGGDVDLRAQPRAAPHSAATSSAATVM